jgi:hypothetical protein
MANCYIALAQKNVYFAHMGKTILQTSQLFWFNLLEITHFRGKGLPAVRQGFAV